MSFDGTYTVEDVEIKDLSQPFTFTMPLNK